MCIILAYDTDDADDDIQKEYTDDDGVDDDGDELQEMKANMTTTDSIRARMSKN